MLSKIWQSAALEPFVNMSQIDGGEDSGGGGGLTQFRIARLW